MTTVNEALERAPSREGRIAGACLDARQVATVLASFYQALIERDVDTHTACQLTLIYARRVLQQQT
jgi:hypothetical protein